MKKDTPSYVLVTPARNEEDFIETTIQSVVAQTVLPRKWVIVSDGSTDGTDDIVRRYAGAHDFIELLRAESEGAASFGSKARAFAAGFHKIGDTTYDFVGNLDADVSFQTDYFERLVGEFRDKPELGLAGGIIQELIDGQYVEQRISLNSVAGAVQLFRCECFYDTGGYPPLDRGGIDSAAEVMARMYGWEVRTVPELPVLHHRQVVTGSGTALGARFNQGVINYSLGYHPLFQLAIFIGRGLDPRRILKHPGALPSALWMLWGYVHSALTRYPRKMPRDFVKFLRAEQLARLGLRATPKPARHRARGEERAEA